MTKTEEQKSEVLNSAQLEHIVWFQETIQNYCGAGILLALEEIGISFSISYHKGFQQLQFHICNQYSLVITNDALIRLWALQCPHLGWFFFFVLYSISCNSAIWLGSIGGTGIYINKKQEKTIKKNNNCYY